MKLVLDTHAFLWFHLGDARLSLDRGNEKLVSPAVFWGIAIKVSLKKLQFSTPYQTLVDDAIVSNGFVMLPIKTRHTAVVATLPLRHRDPFGRLLLAQAMAESADIISRDVAFDAYPIRRR